MKHTKSVRCLSMLLAVMTLMSALCVSASAAEQPLYPPATIPKLFIDDESGLTYLFDDSDHTDLHMVYATDSHYRPEGRNYTLTEENESYTMVAIPQGTVKNDEYIPLDKYLPNVDTVVIPRSMTEIWSLFSDLSWSEEVRTFNIYYEGTAEEWDDNVKIIQSFITAAKKGYVCANLYVNCTYYTTGELDGDYHIDKYHRLGQYDPAQHTVVTATTSSGQTETYDIKIDPEYYDISYETVSVTKPNGVTLTGTKMTTKSDYYAHVTSQRYIEHVVIPDGTTTLISASGCPSIVVIPRSLTTIDSLFENNFVPINNAAGEYNYNPYWPHFRILYQGTEAEWQKIAVYAQWNGEKNYAQELYEQGYVRFNCNYYDVAKPIGTKTEEKPVETKPSAPTVSTMGGGDVTATQFTDVKTTDYYGSAVLWAVNEGVTTGVTSTTFQPNATCTQAQILTFLFRAKGATQKMSFPDNAMPFGMTSSDYFYKAACWAYYYGIIDDSWNPSAPCTRATAMEYIYKAEGSPSSSASNRFSDVSSGASYAKAVAWAVDQGITTGTTDSTFSPGKTCTRGQIVTFLHRYYG